MKFKYRATSARLKSVSPHQRPHKQSSTTVEDELEGSLEHKIDKLFTGQDLLFERLHSEPKLGRYYTKAQHGIKKSAIFVKKQPVLVKVVAIVVLALGSGGVYYSQNQKPADSAISTVAGVTSEPTATPRGNSKLPRDKPEFDLLYPSGKSYSDFEVARTSPEVTEPAYTYIDSLDDQVLNVSVQKLPSTFEYNPAVELERVAKEFQAIDVIQIDAMKVFHGVSDKNKQQSLIFIKGDLLVLIKSPQKLSDEAWAGYILNLKKS